MRTYAIVRKRGRLAGFKAAGQGYPEPCPYKQYPLSQLRKYRAWVSAYIEAKESIE